MRIPNAYEKSVFQSRREAFLNRLEPNGIAILPSAPRVYRNLDIPYPYRQDNNFYYLTGLEHPDTIAVMDAASSRKRFILFLPRQKPRDDLYEGKLLDRRKAQEAFGADEVLYTDQFPTRIMRIVKKDRPIYYTFGIHPMLDQRIYRLFVHRRSGGLWPILDPAPIIAEMRLIKTEADFRMGFQQALDITITAVNQTLPTIRPGLFEYQIQATLEYHFRRQGSPRTGFSSIVASGPNSCILHYTQNRRRLQQGEVLLLDCGAEFGYYTADVTRTVPISGRFNPQQLRIYNIVLQAHQTAIRQIRPGVTRKQVDNTLNDFLADALLELGLIRRKKDYKHYTIHGYMHWLGLDVHDVGGYTRNGKSIAFQPGMVLTIEPGVYIREDVLERLKKAGNTPADLEKIAPRVREFLHIGIRVEDDLIVTRDGCRVLTEGIPREAEEIEALMQS